jgi:hypothetical protein
MLTRMLSAFRVGACGRLAEYDPTHKELVSRAEKWLRSSRGCAVVITELRTAAGEIPDAIGWKGCESTLVECKTSRSDFQRDHNKMWHRANAGVGNLRYYLVPVGLVKREEVPPNWGLLTAARALFGLSSVRPSASITTRWKTGRFRRYGTVARYRCSCRRSGAKGVDLTSVERIVIIALFFLWGCGCFVFGAKAKRTGDTDANSLSRAGRRFRGTGLLCVAVIVAFIRHQLWVVHGPSDEATTAILAAAFWVALYGAVHDVTA